MPGSLLCRLHVAEMEVAGSSVAQERRQRNTVQQRVQVVLRHRPELSGRGGNTCRTGSGPVASKWRVLATAVAATMAAGAVAEHELLRECDCSHRL